MIPWPGLRKWLQHSSHPGQISDTGWPHWASRWIVQFWRQSHKPCCPQQNRKPWLRTCSSNILPNSVESELPNFIISAYHGGKIGKERCPSAAPSLSALGQIHEPGRCQRVGSHISANELYRKRMKTYLDVVIICYNVAMCVAFSDVCSFVSRYLESLEGLGRPAHWKIGHGEGRWCNGDLTFKQHLLRNESNMSFW